MSATFRFRPLAVSFAAVVVAVLPVVSAAQALSPASSIPSARVIVKFKAGSSLLTRGGGAEDGARATAQSSGRAMADGVADTGAGRRAMAQLGSRIGVELASGRQLGPRIHVAQASGLSSQALVAKLSQQSDVEYVVEDHLRFPRLVPNDPLLPAATNHPYVAAGQWYLKPPDGTTPAAIDAIGAWDLTLGSSAVTVAVLDTGVRLDHADMAGKFLNGYNMVSDGAQAGNGVGRSSDPSDLGDYLTAAEIKANPVSFPSGVCSVANTSSWHGTQVAGIVGAATDNGVGIAGVGGNVSVLPVRVLGKCGGYDSDIIAGMRWAAGLTVDGVTAKPSQAARVINLSLGARTSCSQAYKDALVELAAAGVVVVASAGNNVGLAVESPANCPGVIAVGGLRHVGTKVGYSAVGSEVTISAPGGNCVNESGQCTYPILTTFNTGTTKPVSHANGGSTYTNSSLDISAGTSFSAPMVSGAVALMLSVRPQLTPDTVKRILQATARPFPSSGVPTATSACHAPTTSEQVECYCTTSTCGAGMLDVADAVAKAQADAVAKAQADGVAVVSVSPSSPTEGESVSLSGVNSLWSNLATKIVSYKWELVDGGGIVSALVGDSTGSVISAQPSGAGHFVVKLTVTDDVSHTASAEQTVTVQAKPATTPSSGGGGGGGALDDLTLVLLALWVLCAAAVAGSRRASGRGFGH